MECHKWYYYRCIFLPIINMAFTISVDIPYMIKISFIFPRLIELKDFENRRLTGMFLDFTPYSIRRMVIVMNIIVID